MPVNFAGRPHNRNLLPDETLCTYTAFGSSFRSMCRLSNACSRLSDSGEGTKEWEIEDEPVNGARRPSSLQFPPLFGFALSQFPRVYSLRPLHFHSILNNRKKRSQRDWREVVIDGRCICHSWQCFQLAFMVTWKATFSAQSEKFSTNRIVLLISLWLIIWKILYSMIFKQSISYRLLFIMILFRSRSPQKASSILDCEQSLSFLLRHFNI